MIVLSILVLELDPMSFHVGKVLLSLLGRGGSQTFVVLDLVRMPIVSCIFPLVEFRQREK